ncbi:sensor histidine kinase [Actinoplanes sp. NPDC049802]|uniref:sensor histidine kinase n=1 Tax=Actinoplanes sp. NPDC049802 TaxID=3154742 RepID=UPI0033F65BC1
MTLTATGDGAVFDHPGLLYDSRAQYLSGVTTFVREATDAGDAVLVAVPPPNLDLLRGALADLADRIAFADMTVAGRNPGRIIPAVLLAFADAHPRRRVSIVGEPVWPGRTDLEYPACAAHEALINAVFATRDAAILCPYDTGALEPARVRDAWRTHPVMIVGGGRRPSPWYDDPYMTAAAFNQPLPKVPVTAATLAYRHATDLAAVRRFIAAETAGLDPDRGDDLLIAVNELAENTIAHTGAAGTVSVWTEAGRLVCQIDDHGYLADPLAGRVPPPADVEGGRGLILANRLCDLVRIHTGADGTSIRLHIDL